MPTLTSNTSETAAFTEDKKAMKSMKPPATALVSVAVLIPFIQPLVYTDRQNTNTHKIESCLSRALFNTKAIIIYYLTYTYQGM